MKKMLFVLPCMLIPAGAFAQSPKSLPQMSPKAMTAVVEMNQCMRLKVGESGLERINAHAQAFADKVQALCKENKRAEADRVRMEYAETTAKSSDYIKMKACAEQYLTLTDDPAFNQIRDSVLSANFNPNKNVCD